jgi:uncharacterized protein YegL
MEHISSGLDRFGNPEGHAYDLGGGDEDRIRGERILLYLCQIPDGTFAEKELRTLMAERGLRLDIQHAPTGGCPLSAQQLSDYTQLWYVSGNKATLSRQQVQMITDFVRNGNGLAIWADNEPYYADANLLAQALIGTRFSGNVMGDKNMVPGPPQTAGRFIEHQLTLGVNNLYEGITICTIKPAPDVTILGKSHDGQLCLGCFERAGQRAVLDTGFTKLYTQNYHRSAGLGRYLSNIAFWLARGSRGVAYEMLASRRNEITSLKSGGKSENHDFKVTEPGVATCIVQWEGTATLSVTVRTPDGKVAGRGKSATSPLRVTVPTPVSGTWTAMIEGIDVAASGLRYAAKVALETASGTTNAIDTNAVAASKDSSGATQARTERRPKARAQGRIVLPFYLVSDVSAAAQGTIDDFTTALHKLQQGLARDPVLDDIVALSVLPFNDTAYTAVKLAAPSAMDLPVLRADGNASYSAALREYHRVFEQDRARLKAEGARVARAGVFFLTHGTPRDRTYQGTFRSLLGYDPATKQGNRAYPNVVAIGLPGANRESLLGLGYPDFGETAQRGRWYLTDDAPTALERYRIMVQIIHRTIAATVQATKDRATPLFSPPASVRGAQSGVVGE